MTKNQHQPQRDSLYEEQALILSQQVFAGDQVVIRLQAPATARHARAGSFVHMQCSPERPMRRPFSIMLADAKQGWIDILYKIVGEGTRLLAQQTAGQHLSVLGPIGRPFQPDPDKTLPLLLGGGVGMPPMIFLANQMRNTTTEPLVLMGSEVPFPFKAQPSQIMIPGMPQDVIAAMPLLEDWGMASRLCSLQGYAGCYEGYITDLAARWLDTLAPAQLKQVQVFACGPHPMLEAVAKLAARYKLPCQVSLEEFMACAVGGCAGCVVRVETAQGPAMKRVCVDGPVFEANSVFAH